METELINYDKITRHIWQNLYKKTLPTLTEKELENIKSINDEISLQDVNDVYLPLIQLIRIYKKTMTDLTFSKGLFLQKIAHTQPFIIGISGSVAVGKSTIARLLQLLLARTFKTAHVELVTTDGFLYPNQTLIDKKLLDRKGFPESYDMETLITFLSEIKSGKDVEIPVYSHETYDILPDKELVKSPDILIIEGINVFQSTHNKHLYINDFFDFSIYVDATESNIERWYLERFKTLLELAKKDTSNYYHQFTTLSQEETLKMAKETWKKVNLVNLREFIEPTRSRAEVILHKDKSHKIDKIYLKKY
ncbi:pantothenate kinase [Lactococcus hodotermopsidis]|uniref:Pantothenate kinase n=1 Tax=Pseudolactococcus hodotermopsidis TaxID=2709157 RepID=A0A6A0BBR2_9LACT|nr:type I pantothenate kinase [Lactococcus hodotermopsidis]GFH41858.1 pantothenate kinase [Lactococcus hodotermopsidis]